MSCVAPFFSIGLWPTSVCSTMWPGPRPTYAYQVASWSIQRFGHNRDGPKNGGLCLCAPFLRRGAGSPSNTISLGPRPTSLPSGVHPAIWPAQIWAENWGLCPVGEGELGPNLTHCGQGRGHLHAKFLLDSSNRLATIHQRYRQDRTDRQTGQTTVR